MKKKLLLLGLIVTNMLTYGRNAQTQPSTPNYVTKEEFDVLKKNYMVKHQVIKKDQ